MDDPKFIVSNQKEESINIQRVNAIGLYLICVVIFSIDYFRNTSRMPNSLNQYQARTGSNLLVKAINRQQQSLLAGKESIHVIIESLIKMDCKVTKYKTMFYSILLTSK